MYCYIFGAIPVENFHFNINPDDLVIAADAGIKNLENLSIKPDYIIGDFDSLGYEPTEKNVITHPIEKDDTDTLLAIKHAFNLGYNNFRIFGCIGGRLDHTMGSIQTAAYIAENNGTAVFWGNNENFSVIKNNKISFSNDCNGNISVFALSNATGVTIKNLYYELKNGDLTPDFPLGVSNKFISKEASVSVTNGKLLIIWENKSGCYIIGGEK